MDREAAERVCTTVADALASPSDAQRLGLPQGWHPQSLAYGAAGIALLHIERARSGQGPWQRAHDWLACAVAEPVVTGKDAHLHYGAPAVAFALHAAADRPGRYARALTTLDQHIARATLQRLERAHARMDVGSALPALAEFDAIRGLAGIGAYLLQREPHGDLIREVLSYLIRLTEPVKDDGELLPGWWTDQAPSGRPSSAYPGGHANNGMAHGIAGPLALLGLAARKGITVDGHLEAMARICAWFDRWRQGGAESPWWPGIVTRAHLRGEQPLPTEPSRPSWCYGTGGLARSQQLAALATGDTARRQLAEDALASAVTDPGQIAQTTDGGLCHGFAGLAHIAGRAAADALTPAIAACVPHLLVKIDTDMHEAGGALLRPGGRDIGLLDGGAGIALALHAAATSNPPVSGWDAFLLIS